MALPLDLALEVNHARISHEAARLGLVAAWRTSWDLAARTSGVMGDAEAARVVRAHVLATGLDRVRAWTGWRRDELEDLHAELVAAGRTADAAAFRAARLAPVPLPKLIR